MWFRCVLKVFVLVLCRLCMVSGCYGMLGSMCCYVLFLMIVCSIGWCVMYVFYVVLKCM